MCQARAADHTSDAVGNSEHNDINSGHPGSEITSGLADDFSQIQY